MATGQRDGSLLIFYSLTYLKSVCFRSLWLKIYHLCVLWGKNSTHHFFKTFQLLSSFCTLFKENKSGKIFLTHKQNF